MLHKLIFNYRVIYNLRGVNYRIFFIEVLWKLNEIIYLNHLTQFLAQSTFSKITSVLSSIFGLGLQKHKPNYKRNKNWPT